MTLAHRLKQRYPRAYGMARQAAEPVLRELRFLSKVGVRLLVEQVVRKAQWRAELPLQRTLRVELPDVVVAGFDDLRRYLVACGAQYREGTHTLYLSPEALRRTALRLVMARYPAGCGLKIVKNPLKSGNGQYLRESGQSLIQRAVIYSPRELLLVANFLHLNALGPRLYDMVELHFGKAGWNAYVVTHCDGDEPDLEQCMQGIERMRELAQRGAIELPVPGGFEHPDFTCPSCGGNAVVDRTTGGFRYVDFQNFVLGNYEGFMAGLAAQAAQDTHFGDESIFRGGRYLYQSIPGLNVPAKRSTQTRAALLERSLVAAGVSLSDRLVLDYGCNQGMMMALYLKLGARWCHGWDLPRVVPHAERLLLATGCTRFSVAGAVVDDNFSGYAALPDFLKRALPGCIVSYLAMRRHVGWLRELAELPWAAMIVEGHEGESESEFLRHLKSLGERVAFRIATCEQFRDGDCGARFGAILVRSPS